MKIARIAAMASLGVFVTACKTTNKTSDANLESVAVQPRSNSKKIVLYRANTQNVKRYDCPDMAAAKDYTKDCILFPDVVLKREFKLSTSSEGFADQESEDIWAALTDTALHEDDEIKSGGVKIADTKIRKLFREMFNIYAGDGASSPGSGKVVMPNYSKNGNPIDTQFVLAAMKAVKARYYGSDKSAYTQGKIPPKDEAEQCMSVCPPKWSDLTCHYYSWMPSYSQVVPNIRGCFSSVAKGRITKQNGKVLSYPEVYDYCVYQDFDAVLGRAPAYDPALIAKNKAKGKKPGVMAWISDNQDDAFRYIMFASGHPFAFDKKQEQDVINEFWRVDLKGKLAYTAADTDQVNECNKKRSRRTGDPHDGTHCSHTKDQSYLR